MTLAGSRAWLRGLTALALLLAVFFGTGQPTIADDHRPPGAAEGRNLYDENKESRRYANLLLDHPLLSPITELRMALSNVLFTAGIEAALKEGKGRGEALADAEQMSDEAFVEFRNGASELFDSRQIKLSEKDLNKLASKELTADAKMAWTLKRVPFKDVAPFLNPEVRAELERAGVEQLIALSALNIRKDLHSEDVIDSVKKELGIDAQALTGTSERQQCDECAGHYSPETPTFFVGVYDASVKQMEQLNARIIKLEEQYGKLGPQEVLRRQKLEIEKFQADVKPRNNSTSSLLRRELDKTHDIMKARRAGIADKAATPFTTPKAGPKDTLKKGCSKGGTGSQAPGANAQGLLIMPVARANPCRNEANQGKATPSTGLVDALSLPGAAPGGIDFSSMELRYLSDPGDGSGLQYSFSADRDFMKGDPRTSTGLTAADQTSDAFFVWLALNPTSFWVNLNPNEPDRIVDHRLGQTDAGRIMLEADLRMKKTIGKLIHPKSRTGREFWGRVTGDCMSYRTWILSAPASVHQDGDALYILDAPLDVQMETMYMEARGKAAAAGCPRTDKATEERNEDLFRTLILPKLRHAINYAPEYAELRRVYLARVAAEWYRGLSQSKDTAYGDLVDKGDVTDWQTETDWKPTDTFDRYVDSYSKGEFKVTEEEQRGDGRVYVRTYSYGGVDLSKIAMSKVSNDRFTAEHATLAEDIDRSLNAPSAAGDDTVWLGAPTPRQAAGLGPPEGPLSTGEVTLRLLPVALALLGVLLWWRRRRLNAPGVPSSLRLAATGTHSPPDARSGPSPLRRTAVAKRSRENPHNTS
ncbi:hypothetical protein [Streptomyces flavidovirens]|uniref:Secreted protein n=1 Tax=Streptomyces flavidovirens TaxID=67298 RepID=A0ABW6RF42_9ACTN